MAPYIVKDYFTKTPADVSFQPGDLYISFPEDLEYSDYKYDVKYLRDTY